MARSRRLLLLTLAALALVFLVDRHEAQAGLRQWFTGSFTALGSANTTQWTPCRDHTGVTVFFKPTRAGTFRVQRLDSAGNWNNLSSAITTVADTEDQVFIGGPVTTIRGTFTDTSNNTGTYLIEFVAACTR